MQEKQFDSEYKKPQEKTRQLSTQKHRPPDNQDLCIQYGETLKQHKQTLRTKKLIEDTINSNSFWDHWKTLNKIIIII